jgi:hypothetical protein
MAMSMAVATDSGPRAIRSLSLVVGIPDLVDRADAGVIESRRRHRLAPESGPRLGIGRSPRGQELERHLPVEPGVGREEDDAESAAPDLAQQTVRADPLPRPERRRERIADGGHRPFEVVVGLLVGRQQRLHLRAQRRIGPARLVEEDGPLPGRQVEGCVQHSLDRAPARRIRRLSHRSAP